MIEKELFACDVFFSQLVQHHVARDPSPAGDALRTCSGQLDLLFSLPLYTIGSIWIYLDLFAKPSSRFHPAMPVHLDLFGSISETRVYFYRWGQVTSDIPYTEKPEVSKNGLFRAIYK